MCNLDPWPGRFSSAFSSVVWILRLGNQAVFLLLYYVYIIFSPYYQTSNVLQ